MEPNANLRPDPVVQYECESETGNKIKQYFIFSRFFSLSLSRFRIRPEQLLQLMAEPARISGWELPRTRESAWPP